MGILDPLPRTPHVFEEQLKWPLENSWEASLAWVPNYSSVEEHADFARAKSRRTFARVSWLRCPWVSLLR